ncbi:UDP-N-acetylmuramoyl-tripeptide--D-alanyl-D-alanine ligase [Atopococcus tabaci]|uniref:UDP-N-acetylmuramoyl-tripeptide--D-alanyl-D- alanine ligase n=1 Tax=Atopococcus tabaci TaxID=269774 RepID=UPI00240A5DDC|nr:UDP-N-acetylmuramoyl-tripeptide--D-alanyl-D-alanine ligase [Atopococcus tabaci]
MSKWTLGEIARAVNAQNDVSAWEEIEINSVAFDTRKLTEGSLFVPLIGNQDGHKFIEDAIQNGAQAAFWSRPLSEAPTDFPVIQVEDTLQALQQFATYYLNKVAPLVVGITGSNGKTTTKDMTAAVLSTKYKTHKTQGNFNNEIGMPVTILDMPEDAEAVVLEMGMSGKGEIKQLSELAEPDVAIITMIGESHIEFFGSREGIADTKMEIISGLKPNGVLIFPGEEPLLVERTAQMPEEKKRTFGNGQAVSLRPLQVNSELRNTSFTTNLYPEQPIQLPIPGTYNVQNALAALLAGMELDVPYEKAAESLAEFQLTKNRLEWLDGKNGTILLNDAYNASPTSMKAVLRYFASIDTDTRKFAVLGDIRELGELSRELHLSVKEAIEPERLDEVVLYGKEMRALYEALRDEFPSERLHHFQEDKAELISYIEEHAQTGDYILLKSSFGTDLLSVANALRTEKNEM